MADQDFVDPANPNGPYYNDGKDCNGHGTHVAGTVGGASYGVAKSVSLVGVRVLDCEGYGLISEIVAGVDWVTRNAAKPAVANMSLGGGGSTALDSAVSRSIAAGITYAVAAGNEHRDACAFSPARVGAAITVAASDRTDRRPQFSNYGSCVDWFSPGVGITSDWFTSDTATATLNGTSMASPHTAGAAAQYLESNPAASPATVRSALYTQATKARIARLPHHEQPPALHGQLRADSPPRARAAPLRRKLARPAPAASRGGGARPGRLHGSAPLGGGCSAGRPLRSGSNSFAGSGGGGGGAARPARGGSAARARAPPAGGSAGAAAPARRRPGPPP